MNNTVIILGSLALAGIVIAIIVQKKKSATIERIRKKVSKIVPEILDIPINEGLQSETEDKTVITLCVKDPSTGKDYMDNTLVYVLLHEVAHIRNPPEYSEHGSEWASIFSSLLDEAQTAGIYNPMIAMEDVYCGVPTKPKGGNIKVHSKRDRKSSNARKNLSRLSHLSRSRETFSTFSTEVTLPGRRGHSHTGSRKSRKRFEVPSHSFPIQNFLKATQSKSSGPLKPTRGRLVT